MRQQIVAGNWKMNNTLSEGSALVSSILEKFIIPKGLSFWHLRLPACCLSVFRSMGKKVSIWQPRIVIMKLKVLTPVKFLLR